MPNQDSLNARFTSLMTRLADNQDHITQALQEIQDLRQLTKYLSKENTFFRGRLRALESPSQVPRERAPDQASTAHSPAVESASQGVPRQTLALIPPRKTDLQDYQDQDLSPPSYDDFMKGVRTPYSRSAPQVLANPRAASHPLEACAAPAPLVTTCDMPTQEPLPPQTIPPVANHNQEGLYCPDLAAHVPMLTPFKLAVSYRHYRLKDTRAMIQDWESELLYKVKPRFDSMYPTNQAFDGTKPIKLLEFLAALKEGFDALRVSEAMAVLVMAYHLKGQAKTHYTALTSPGVRTTTSSLGGTWPFLVDLFIKRYLTDDVLKQRTTRSRMPCKNKTRTKTRSLTAWFRQLVNACNFFEESELVNFYIRGLLLSKRDAVTERVMKLPLQEQGDLTAPRRVAQAEGNTYQSRRTTPTPSTPRSKTRSPAMLVNDDLGVDNMTPIVLVDINMGLMYTSSPY